MAETDRPVYSIGAVARMLDLSPSTLRTWQDRYNVVVPARSAGGQRLYSREQLAQLRFLAEQVSAGVSPADAHRLLTERLEGGGPVIPPSDRPPDRRLLILLAERDPYAAEYVEYFLRTEGYEVTVATDAEQATRLAVADPPDLAVVELMISGGVGTELCRQLKSGTDTAVLAVSTLDVGDEAFTAGADAFLLKPVDSLQLVSAVRDLLGASALARPPRHGAP